MKFPRIALALLLLALVGVARAEEGEERPAPVPAPAPAPAPAPEEADPFSPGAALREAGDQEERRTFVPRDDPEALPQLVLRGYIEDAVGTTVALLEVEGRTTYLVRKGDTVSLPSRGRNTVVRVTELGNLELRVEVGELRREVVVR